MANTKKTDNEVKEIKKEKKTPIKKTEDNDFFNPENMAKMYAIFKQFQQMEQEGQVKQEEIKEEKKYKKSDKFTKVMLTKIGDETVTVKSAVDNVIFKSPKTQMKYTWISKGNVEVLTISEILAMENTSERFLHTPWLIIEDERVVQALGLEKLYSAIEKVEDIESLINMSSDEIRNIFESLPNNYKSNFRDEVYMKVKNKELRDIVIIDTLSDILGIKLRD